MFVCVRVYMNGLISTLNCVNVRACSHATFSAWMCLNVWPQSTYCTPGNTSGCSLIKQHLIWHMWASLYARSSCVLHLMCVFNMSYVQVMLTGISLGSSEQQLVCLCPQSLWCLACQTKMSCSHWLYYSQKILQNSGYSLYLSVCMRRKGSSIINVFLL